MSRPASSIVGRLRALLLLVPLLGAGCYTTTAPYEVMPFDGEAIAELDADQIVDLMVGARFTREEILDLGVDLRNALASQGGAKIRNNKYTAAIFFVQNGAVFVAIREGDDLLYPLEETEETPK